MQRAGAILTHVAVPPIAIARDPRVKMLREKMNAWDKKQPRDQLPTGQRETDARPSVGAGVHAPAGIDRLHQAHRVVDIDSRKARGHAGIVQVQQFYARARVHASHASDARAAQLASAIVEHSKLGHVSPRSAVARNSEQRHNCSARAAYFILASKTEVAHAVHSLG